MCKVTNAAEKVDSKNLDLLQGQGEKKVKPTVPRVQNNKYLPLYSALVRGIWSAVSSVSLVQEEHGAPGRGPAETTKMTRGQEHLSCAQESPSGKAEGLGPFQP